MALQYLGSISPTYLRTAFACTDPKSVKRLTTLLSFLRFWAPLGDEIEPWTHALIKNWLMKLATFSCFDSTEKDESRQKSTVKHRFMTRKLDIFKPLRIYFLKAAL